MCPTLQLPTYCPLPDFFSLTSLTPPPVVNDFLETHRDSGLMTPPYPPRFFQLCRTRDPRWLVFS